MSEDADLERLLAEFATSGLRELHVRHDGLEIYLSTDTDALGFDAPGVVVQRSVAGVPPVAAAPPVVPAAASAPQEWPDGAVTVKAPYLGTFYRSPKPGSPPYVERGDTIDADAELCLVEVMKLFTAVRAGTTGTVHAILAADGDMVAADQPLFVILPA